MIAISKVSRMQEADSVTSKKSFRSSREALFPDRRPSMFVAGPVCRVWAGLIEYDNRVSATVRSPEYVANEDVIEAQAPLARGVAV
jgi:hypothetical protein